MSELAIFSGSAHPDLAQDICDQLGVPLRPTRLKRFSNDCLEVQLQANCREQDVFIIQPLSAPVQDNLMELLLMLDAARGASAARITAVIPYFSYARSDKKDAPRISLGGRLVADLLATAGANRVLTMALAAFAKRLGLPVAAAAKERLDDTTVKITTLIGEVRHRDVIVLDDEIASGGSILELLAHLRAHGARSVRVATTHGIFAGASVERLAGEADIAEIVCTSTVPIAASKHVPKLTVLSVAPAFAEAIRRINSGESVSALFYAEPEALGATGTAG